jgi:hypothetical protein
VNISTLGGIERCGSAAPDFSAGNSQTETHKRAMAALKRFKAEVAQLKEAVDGMAPLSTHLDRVGMAIVAVGLDVGAIRELQSDIAALKGVVLQRALLLDSRSDLLGLSAAVWRVPREAMGASIAGHSRRLQRPWTLSPLLRPREHSDGHQSHRRERLWQLHTSEVGDP